jgi:hypothetical protein
MYREAIAALLDRIAPGKYGTRLFDSLARLTWSIAEEAVMIRINPKTRMPEVFLRKRASLTEGETAYPDMWHAPGSVTMPGETPRMVMNRLGQKEFGCNIIRFVHVADFSGDDTERGSFWSRVNLVWPGRKPPRIDERHQWVPINKLHLYNMVDSHLNMIIPAAVLAWYASEHPALKIRARLEFLQ